MWAKAILILVHAMHYPSLVLKWPIKVITLLFNRKTISYWRNPDITELCVENDRILNVIKLYASFCLFICLRSFFNAELTVYYSSSFYSAEA